MSSAGAEGLYDAVSVAGEPGFGVVRECASQGVDGGESGSELGPVRGEAVQVSGRWDDVSSWC